MREVIPEGKLSWAILVTGPVPMKIFAEGIVDDNAAAQRALREALPPGPVAGLEYGIINHNRKRLESGPATWLLRPPT